MPLVAGITLLFVAIALPFAGYITIVKFQHKDKDVSNGLMAWSVIVGVLVGWFALTLISGGVATAAG
jgi:hypothetical protein